MAVSNSGAHPYVPYTVGTTTTPNTTTISNTALTSPVLNTGTVYMTGSNGTHGAWGAGTGMVDSAVQESDLKKEVFGVPISRLIDLWTARFGNEWANLEDIDNDEFFSLAYKRLKQLGELEVHYLTDRARYVCRVPE